MASIGQRSTSFYEHNLCEIVLVLDWPAALAQFSLTVRREIEFEHLEMNSPLAAVAQEIQMKWNSLRQSEVLVCQASAN